MLFLYLQALILLFYLINLRPYQSDLDTITPEIKTPKTVCQFQHDGSRIRKRTKLSAALSLTLISFRSKSRFGQDMIIFIEAEELPDCCKIVRKNHVCTYEK